MRIKFKRSLMLTALSAFAAVGAIAPLAVTACGNDSSSSGGSTSTDSGLNAGLPPNWTQADLEKAVSDYAESIKTKTDDELMQALNDFMKQLNDANTTAYDGLNKLAICTALPTRDLPFGSWSLQNGETIQDVYDFFVHRISKGIFPTLDKIIDHIINIVGGPNILTPEEQVATEIGTFMFMYSYIAPEFTYAKMSAIVQQLANNKALDKQQNIETIATTLRIMDYEAYNSYGLGPWFDETNSWWCGKYMYDTLNKFVDIYSQIPFTITNDDFDKEIYQKTGLAPFTIYTTTPSVVTPKTTTNPTA